MLVKKIRYQGLKGEGYMYKILRVILVPLLLFLPDITLAADLSFEEILAASNEGDADAQNALGLIYFYGQKGKEKIPEALIWFTLSASKGHMAAKFNLGIMLYKGVGIAPDKKQAKQLFEESYPNINPDAVYIIGTIYQGEGDFLTAAKFVRIAAEKGCAEAQNRLGYFYSNGLGVTKDFKLGHEWYLKAANQGYTKAQYNIGQDYLFGMGVEKNEDIAMIWFKSAAAKEYPDAQIKLATLYYQNGDKEKGQYWFNRVTRNGDDNIRNFVKRNHLDNLSQSDKNVMGDLFSTEFNRH